MVRYVIAYFRPPMRRLADGYFDVESWDRPFAKDIEFEQIKAGTGMAVHKHAMNKVRVTGKHYRFSEVQDGRPLDEDWVRGGWPSKIFMPRRNVTW